MASSGLSVLLSTCAGVANGNGKADRLTLKFIEFKKCAEEAQIRFFRIFKYRSYLTRHTFLRTVLITVRPPFEKMRFNCIVNLKH